MRYREPLSIAGILFVSSMMFSLGSPPVESISAAPSAPPSSDTPEQPQADDLELLNMLALAQVAPPVAQMPSTGIQRGGRPAPVELTDEFIDQCMDVAEQVNPDWAKKMRGLCDRNSVEFARVLRVSGRQLIGLVQLRQRDPKLYETKIKELQLEAHLNTIIHKLRHIISEGRDSSSQAESLRSQLRALVQDQIALSLKARGDYILRLENHVQALKNQLEQDGMNFFITVEERYQSLTKMPGLTLPQEPTP